jgi:hypothetical protein
MKTTYAIIFKDKMFGYDEFKGGEIKNLKFAADAEKAVRKIAANRLRELNFQADMENRFEIESINIAIEFK